MYLIIYFVFQKFHIPIITSTSGVEYATDSSFCTYFILADFESNEFEELQKLGVKQVLGKPALLDMANGDTPVLVHHNRPVYCHVMRHCFCVFTGFRKKQDLVSKSRLHL